MAVDGVLGIGGRPGLPDDVALLARDLAGFDVPTIAVDLPSGVGADTGAVPGAAFWATQTVTFGERKPCHLIEPARQRCGEVEVVDIGLGDVPSGTSDLWLRQLEVEDLAMRWPYPDARSDKYSRGVVGIDTGSDTYPGAAIMTVYGAVHAGAGMVRFLGADRPAEVIGSQLPNVVFGSGRVQAQLFGSGWGERADGPEVLQRRAGLRTAHGGRRRWAEVPARPAARHWLLTPHAGELARLLDQERSWVTDDPVRAVRAGVTRTGATVLLKGATQLVAGPDRDWVQVALPGPAWTGQADRATSWAACVPRCRGRPARGGRRGAGRLAAGLHRSPPPGPMPPTRLAELAAVELGRLQQQDREATEETDGRRGHPVRLERAAGHRPATARAEIDLAAFRANLAALQAHVGSAEMMVVVKAEGYGHGMIPCAREARAAGAGWLGVATPAEALALRDAGDTGPVLAWLYGVEEDLSPLVAASVDVSAQSVDQISRLVAAAATAERRARVHLKADTGLSRNGAALEIWPEVCAAAAEAEDAGALEVVGVWSHFAASDEMGHPSVPIQLTAFQRAYEVARSAGLEPALRHLANSAGALVRARRPAGSGAGGYRGVRDRPGTGDRRARRGRPQAGDDPALPAGERQADRAGSRGVVRLDLDGRSGDHGRFGAAGLWRRYSPARRQSGRGRLVRRAGADPGAGVHGPVRGRPRARIGSGAGNRGHPVRTR